MHKSQGQSGEFQGEDGWTIKQGWVGSERKGRDAKKI